MQAELVGDTIELVAHRTYKELKEIPGARYVSESKRWVMPLSWATACQLRNVMGSELEIGPELLEWAKQERDTRIAAAEAARTAYDGPVPTRDTERDSTEEEREVKRPEEKWWWDIWQGMPEFINNDLSSWRVVKVHLRNRDDMDAFAKLMGQTVKPGTRSIWFPEAEKRDETEWRWVDEAEDSANLPGSARKPVHYEGRRPEKPKKEPKPKKEGATPKRVPVKDFVGSGRFG